MATHRAEHLPNIPMKPVWTVLFWLRYTSKKFIRSCEQIMETVKQIVRNIADHLPEQATLDDAMYTLYVRQKLEQARQIAKQGMVTSQDEMEQRFLNAR